MATNSAPAKHQETAMSESVPIFLKKTYHMIDSCNPAIAGWDEDGLTFTVKDPAKFETTVIPQFFKHSKFTSFVRQLNFYSFRKIKYSDSIRIDLETEKKTANYWRFRHEHFRQGRADLLTEIKRMNGKANTSSSTTNGSAATGTLAGLTVQQPLPISSSSNVNNAIPTKKIQVAEKSEVLKLKKRIEEMTKTMDKLTEMVQKVTLQQDHVNDDEPYGMKRKKVNARSVETQAMDMDMPDVAFSHMMDLEELADLPLPPTDIPSPPPSLPASRESSDNEFVDQLFTAFHDDNDEAADWMSHDVDDGSISSNRPDPELMKRLSDALQLLPREIQEMIVNRLIAAITSTDGLDVPSSAVPVAAAAAVPQVEPKKVAAANKALPVADEAQQQQPLPLAAATLAALLHHYSNQVKEAGTTSPQAKKNLKSLPVIPVHA